MEEIGIIISYYNKLIAADSPLMFSVPTNVFEANLFTSVFIDFLPIGRSLMNICLICKMVSLI